MKIIGNGKENIELYCNFSKLEKICINSDKEINNIDFPIFNYECNNEFESLTDFSFVYKNKKLSLDILLNIYYNLDKMKKLKKFTLECVKKTYFKKFLYDKFKNKLLKSKLKANINISEDN